MAERMHDRAIPAGTLAIYPPSSWAAATETLLDRGQHFPGQKILPGAGGSGVDILIAANPGEAIRKRKDGRRHALLADQAVQAFRHVLAKPLPIGLRQAAAGDADEIDQ